MDADQILDTYGTDAADGEESRTPAESATAIIEADVREPEAPPKAERVRDDAGKFIRGKPKLASDGQPPVLDDEDDTPEPVAEDGAVEQPPAETDHAKVEQDRITAIPATPWKFGWAGKEVAIPGALEKKGHGVFIPDTPEGTGYVRQQMLQAQKIPQMRGQIQHLRAQLSQGTTRHAVENAAFVEVLGPLLKPDTFERWFTEAQQNPGMAQERLVLALQREQLKIERELGANLIEPAEAGQLSPEDREDAAHNLEDVFEHVVASEWPDIDAATKGQLESEIAKDARAFFQQAAQDDPQGRWSRGGIAPNAGLILRLIRGEKASRPAPAPKAAPPVPPTRPPVPAKAPPSVGGATRNIAGTGSAPAKPTSGSGFKSRQDVLDYYENS